MDISTEYTYTDGNGNRYEITTSSLEYIPVIPAESSSGVYSGGEKKSIILDRSQFKTIREILESTLERKEIHIPNRVMMSGMIVKKSSADSSTVFISPGAAEKEQIEALLKEFLTPQL